MIEITFGKMIIPEKERFIGFAGDNLHSTKTFLLKNESKKDCIYRLYLTFDDGTTNYFVLDSKVENGSTILVWSISDDHIIKSGIVKAQIKAFYEDEKIYHTTHDYFIVASSAECDGEFSEKENSEFLEYEKRLNELFEKITAEEERFVPITRTIAGKTLAENISAKELSEALSTYPIKKLSSDPTTSTDICGEVSQLGYLVNYDGNKYIVKLYICRSVSDGNYYWEEISTSSCTHGDLSIYVPTTRKIAGIDMEDDITVEELSQSLSVYPVLSGDDVPHNGTDDKAYVGQLYIALENGSLHRCYATAGGGYTYWQEINANPKGKIAGFTLNEDVTIQMLQTALGIDEIETALDSIISIQENLIGGAET